MDRTATLALLHDRLAALAPASIELFDDSAQHAGHAGAREGGHFRLEIVAECFAGKNRLQRQRLVLDCVGNLREAGIHALSVSARSPGDV